MVRVGPEMLQAILLAARPLRDIVHRAFHAGVVVPQEAEHLCFRPDVAFPRGVVDLAGVAVAGRVAGPVYFDPFVSQAASTASDGVRGRLDLLLELLEEFRQFAPGLHYLG